MPLKGPSLTFFYPLQLNLLRKQIEDAQEDVENFLMDIFQSEDANANEKSASIVALATIASWFAKSSSLVSNLLEFMKENEKKIKNFTDEEIGILETPPGQLFHVGNNNHLFIFAFSFCLFVFSRLIFFLFLFLRNSEILDKFRDQEKAVSREKKKRGEHRMYSADDELWEKNLKKELEKKKKVN